MQEQTLQSEGTTKTSPMSLGPYQMRSSRQMRRRRSTRDTHSSSRMVPLLLCLPGGRLCQTTMLPSRRRRRQRRQAARTNSECCRTRSRSALLIPTRHTRMRLLNSRQHCRISTLRRTPFRQDLNVQQAGPKMSQKWRISSRQHMEWMTMHTIRLWKATTRIGSLRVSWHRTATQLLLTVRRIC